jgi:signal transduction histidine kinase
MKDAFISTVSHELRTPLTVIREVIAQMEEGILGPTTEKQERFLKHVLESVDRLGLIINDLLDVSKIEAGKMQLYMEDFDLTKVACGTLELFQPVASKKGIELKLPDTKKPIRIHADRDKVIQMLNNLIGNALKFTKQGHVGLRIVKNHGSVECSVYDTGRGIAEEDLKDVFNKFQQFGYREGAGEKGTGLGLAICKGIVELHHGSIRVESRLNEGTAFTFSIPQKSET